MSKIGWDDYFFGLASAASKKSTCIRRQIGAIIIRDNEVIATGFNHAPFGQRNCQEYGKCQRDELKIQSGLYVDKCFALHAEVHAIVHAAKCGHPLYGSTMYVKVQPCNACARAMIVAGIKTVIYREKYPFSESDAMFARACVTVIQSKGEE